jgi:hypothetical protein
MLKVNLPSVTAAVRNGFKHVARRLEELEVDTVIVIGDDH